MVDDEIFFIDLNKVTLLGWERRSLFSEVEQMVEAIERGEEFPPVPIKKIDETTYTLTDDLIHETSRGDGGHHRAIAHYIANKPLKCKPSISSNNNSIYRDFFPISESHLVDELPNLDPQRYFLGFSGFDNPF